MRKLKLFIDLNKEEKWLNGMALKGYELENVTFGYKFRAVKPYEADIKIDFRAFLKNQDFEDYCTIFEDSGWKHIAGNKYSGAQYFIKISDEGREDIFSDSFSRAGRYKRMANMWMLFAITYLPFLVGFISSNFISIKAIINPKMLYYTPGLWEKSGFEFWRAFLFETPFALLRGFSWFVIPALIFLYFVFALKARKLYAKTRLDLSQNVGN